MNKRGRERKKYNFPVKVNNLPTGKHIPPLNYVYIYYNTFLFYLNLKCCLDISDSQYKELYPKRRCSLNLESAALHTNLIIYVVHVAKEPYTIYYSIL